MADGLEAGIVTDDVERLSTFYREGMGFDVESDTSYPQGRVVRMARGAARIKLYEACHPPSPAGTPRGLARRGGIRLRLVARR